MRLAVVTRVTGVGRSEAVYWRHRARASSRRREGPPWSAGVAVEDVRLFAKSIELEPWLARAGCDDEEAARVRGLLADRIRDGWVTLDRIALKGRK